jgi:hypothetical protein
MQTQYLPSGQTAQYGDLKPALLLGTAGPVSYSQTTRDPVANPGAGDYIEFPMSAVTVSKNYRVEFYPLSATLRQGAPSASQSGWVAMWFNNTSTAGTVGNEVSAATNLSAEQLVFGAFVSQL